jgi:hypothetical protein
MKTSKEKTKSLAFQGKERIPSKEYIDKRTVEKGDKFTYTP